MLKATLLSILLITSLYANPVQTKEHSISLDICIDTTKHSNKGFKQLKELLVTKAQENAFQQLSKQETGKVSKTILSKSHRKDLKVQVNDIYDDGNKLCNKSVVTINKDRLQYYLPQTITLDRICHKDENLAPKKLQTATALKSYKALIAEVSNKKISDALAKELVHNYSRTDGKMYMSKGAYCLGASGNVIPFEVDVGKSVKKEIFVEEIVVSSKTKTVTMSKEKTKKNKEYIIKVSGTYNAGDTIKVDADYSLTQKIINDNWTDHVSGYKKRGEKLLNLLVNNKSIEWGSFNNNHNYSAKIIGNGKNIELLIYDIYYPNNTGSLLVKIYEINQ